MFGRTVTNLVRVLSRYMNTQPLANPGFSIAYVLSSSLRAKILYWYSNTSTSFLPRRTDSSKISDTTMYKISIISNHSFLASGALSLQEQPPACCSFRLQFAQARHAFDSPSSCKDAVEQTGRPEKGLPL